MEAQSPELQIRWAVKAVSSADVGWFNGSKRLFCHVESTGP